MLQQAIRCAGAALAFLLIQSLARAADIVDTDYVADAVSRGTILWDIRDSKAYNDGHIPGALNVGEIGAVLRNPNTEDWVPTTQVEAILGKGGIDLVGKEVIVYSHTGDPSAYYGFNTVRYFGGKNAKIYHGGLDAWKAAGNPVATEPTKVTPLVLKLAPVEGVVIWNDEMVAKVRQGTAQIVDARTPREYSGDDIRAIRGGHIPKAVNIPYEQNWVDPATAGKLARKEITTRAGMSLKPAADLKKLYANLDPNKETIVYCQSGVRAAETAAVMRDLGFTDVKVYEPSWLGYAGILTAPAEQEVFYNVGALLGRVGGMQNRIDALEAEVEKLKVRQ